MIADPLDLSQHVCMVTVPWRDLIMRDNSIAFSSLIWWVAALSMLPSIVWRSIAWLISDERCLFSRLGRFFLDPHGWVSSDVAADACRRCASSPLSIEDLRNLEDVSNSSQQFCCIALIVFALAAMVWKCHVQFAWKLCQAVAFDPYCLH